MRSIALTTFPAPLVAGPAAAPAGIANDAKARPAQTAAATRGTPFDVCRTRSWSLGGFASASRI
jgi:hypothetical protein